MIYLNLMFALVLSFMAGVNLKNSKFLIGCLFLSLINTASVLGYIMKSQGLV